MSHHLSTGFTVTAAISAVVQLQVSITHAFLMYDDVLSAYIGPCGYGFVIPHFVLGFASVTYTVGERIHSLLQYCT